MAKYQHEFGPATTYGHVLTLIERHTPPDGIIIDLGCGHAPLAEPLLEAGFEYLGADISATRLKDLEERGLSTRELDLTDDGAVRRALADARDEGNVVGVLLLDVLEHLVEPGRLLETVRDGFAGGPDPLLFVSIPNITHIDVAASLLRGDWKYTPEGLLDETHVRFFSEAHATDVLLQAGWRELDRNDKTVHVTEQAVTDSIFAGDTNLARYLDDRVTAAHEHRRTYQFIRTLVPFDGAAVQPRPPDESDHPGLSVLVRTTGTRPELLDETLLSLAAQDTTDFESILLVHALDQTAVAAVRKQVAQFPPAFSRRVRVHQIVGGDRARPLNEGLNVAKGRYIAFLDDDDVALSDWVSTFLTAASRHPGRVIRALVGDQDVSRDHPGRAPYEVLNSIEIDEARHGFHYLRHLAANRTPICGFVVPRQAIEEMGLRFNEDRRVLEDWEFLLRATAVCGVVDTGKVTSVYRRWESGESSLHTVEQTVWRDTRRAILQELNDRPTLLPEGTVIEIVGLYHDQQRLRKQFKQARHEFERASAETTKARSETRAAQAEADRLRRRLDQIERSGSWRVTRPYRAVADFLRGRR